MEGDKPTLQLGLPLTAGIRDSCQSVIDGRVDVNLHMLCDVAMLIYGA